MAFSKTQRRTKIRTRIRGKISGNAQKPRLAVFRSNKEIYAQLIDDTTKATIVSASSQDKTINKGTTKVDQAKQVGVLLSEKAKAANIETCIFDRGGYLYHGRVKSLAEGAREGGLKF